jgi:endonuclease YncB( thermonuclease family)
LYKVAFECRQPELPIQNLEPQLSNTTYFNLFQQKSTMARAYKLIKGHFVIRYLDLPKSGPEPDGDTIKFLPDQRSLVEALEELSGTPPDINDRGISIRLEAIDALETHYPVGQKEFHQELDGANDARDRHLELLGFKDVVFWENLPNKVKSSNKPSLPGYVLSNGIDVHGRLIGFVFPGQPDKELGPDGASVDADNDLIDKSANTILLKEGRVFAAFYKTLPSPLQEHLATVAENARTARKGIWRRATATKNKPANIVDIKALEELVVWPKLFRRLATFFAQTGDEVDQFEGWLRAGGARRDDRLDRLDTGARSKLSDVVTVDDNGIKLDVWPEEIVINDA